MDRKEEKDKEELRYSEELKNRAEMKQSHADKGVRHKNNQREQTKQEREDNRHTRQYQINRLIQRPTVFTKRPVSLPCCVLFTSRRLQLHRIAHNIMRFLAAASLWTDTDRTMQRVSWHFTRLHQHLQPLQKKKKKLITETRHEKMWKGGCWGRHYRCRMTAQRETKEMKDCQWCPCGKTKSCGCWPQQNSWGEAENSRPVSHGHSWPVSLIVWLTQKFILEGTVTDVWWLYSLKLFFFFFYKLSEFTGHQHLLWGSPAPLCHYLYAVTLATSSQTAIWWRQLHLCCRAAGEHLEVAQDFTIFVYMGNHIPIRGHC